MTLQDFKDQVARDKGFRDWDHMFRTYCHPTYRTALNMHIDRAAELYAKEREEEAKVKYFNAGANYGYEAGQYDAISGHDLRKISGPISRISKHIDIIMEQ